MKISPDDIVVEDARGCSIRLACHKGELVTLVENLQDAAPSKIKTTADKLGWADRTCLGEYIDPLTSRTGLVYDLSFNASYQDIRNDHLDTVISTHMKNRIGYELVNLDEKLYQQGYLLHPNNVALDFGIRARPFLVSEPSSIPYDLQKEVKTRLAWLEDKDKYSFKDFLRNCSKNSWKNSLDREADALNIAYFWSGYNRWDDQNTEELAVRKNLYACLMGPFDELNRSQLFLLASRLEDSPVKSLLMGVITLEGFGCCSDLEVAEANLETLLRRVEKKTRMEVMATYLLARIHVQQGRTLAREQMVSLASKGNPFAQVFISRVFAGVPMLGRDGGFQVEELSLYHKLRNTGYGVSQSLASLYSMQLVTDTNSDAVKLKLLKENARRSAVNGDSVGRVICYLFSLLGKGAITLRSSERALFETIFFLNEGFQQTGFYRLDTSRAFLNMLRSREQHPHESVSWLTCMDLCRQRDRDIDTDELWLKLIADKVTEARLTFAVTFELDQETVLNSIDFTKRRSMELVLHFSSFMPSPARETFMQRVRDEYLDASGLRTLAGAYRVNNQRDAARECYLEAGTKKGSSEALLDVAVMYLEDNKSGRAELYGEKAGYPYDTLVAGLVDDVDRSRAMTCFQLAANAGDPCAAWFLGVMQLSKPLLEEAARSGFSEAYKTLAEMCKHENDVAGFWRYREGEAEAYRLSRSFTLRDPVSDAAIVAVFKRRWNIWT